MSRSTTCFGSLQVRLEFLFLVVERRQALFDGLEIPVGREERQEVVDLSRVAQVVERAKIEDLWVAEFEEDLFDGLLGDLISVQKGFVFAFPVAAGKPLAVDFDPYLHVFGGSMGGVDDRRKLCLILGEIPEAGQCQSLGACGLARPVGAAN